MPRYKKKKRVAPKRRSHLEDRVARELGSSWEYEAATFEYFLKRKYLADFVKGDLVVEVKGFFRPGDRPKYLAVRDALLEQGKELIFIFSDPHKRVRKDTKLTMGEWSEKHNIRYYKAGDIDEIL